MRRWPLILGALCLFALPSEVRADSIGNPPTCPPGTRGQSSHAGLWCATAACSSDADCGEARCEERRICTVTAAVLPGGHRGFDEAVAPQNVELAVASCAADASCTGTEETWPPTVGAIANRTPTCSVVRACVPAPLPPLGGFLAGTTPEHSPLVGSPAPTSGAAGASGSLPSASSPTTSAGCGCRAGSPTAHGIGLLVLIGLIAWRRR